MDVVLISEILVIVVHVLAGVNVEVLLLGILDFEEISLNSFGVLSKVCTHNWAVHLSGLSHQDALVKVAKTEETANLPALGHPSEITNIGDGLDTQS